MLLARLIVCETFRVERFVLVGAVVKTFTVFWPPRRRQIPLRVGNMVVHSSMFLVLCYLLAFGTHFTFHVRRVSEHT